MLIHTVICRVTDVSWIPAMLCPRTRLAQVSQNASSQRRLEIPANRRYSIVPGERRPKEGYFLCEGKGESGLRLDQCRSFNSEANRNRNRVRCLKVQSRKRFLKNVSDCERCRCMSPLNAVTCKCFISHSPCWGVLINRPSFPKTQNIVPSGG